MYVFLLCTRHTQAAYMTPQSSLHVADRPWHTHDIIPLSTPIPMLILWHRCVYGVFMVTAIETNGAADFGIWYIAGTCCSITSDTHTGWHASYSRRYPGYLLTNWLWHKREEASKLHITEHLCGEAAVMAAPPHRGSVMWKEPPRDYIMMLYRLVLWQRIYIQQSPRSVV